MTETVKFVSIVINFTDTSRSFASPPPFFFPPSPPLLLSEDWRAETTSAPALHLPDPPPDVVHGTPALPPADSRDGPRCTKGASDGAAALPPHPPIGRPRREREPSIICEDGAKPAAGRATAKIEMVTATMAVDRPGEAAARRILSRRRGAAPRSMYGGSMYGQHHTTPSPRFLVRYPDTKKTACVD